MYHLDKMKLITDSAGTSRKSTLGLILDLPVEVGQQLQLLFYGVAKGASKLEFMIKENYRAMKTMQAILGSISRIGYKYLLTDNFPRKLRTYAKRRKMYDEIKSY